MPRALKTRACPVVTFVPASSGAHSGMDEAARTALTTALKDVDEGARCLDRGDLDGAERHAEIAISTMTDGLSAGWLEGSVPELLASLASPEQQRALARMLWLGCAVDEQRGRLERARAQCRRAMELYARLRIEAEELDQRAALELGAASGRLGATAYAASLFRR